MEGRQTPKKVQTPQISEQGFKALNSSSLGIPDRFRQRRKSSLPFADRSPKVRFLKKADEHSNSDQGSHDPLDEIQARQSIDHQKPILKKSEFPILINVGPSGELQGGCCGINFDIENSAIYVEKVVQAFSSAERESRGSLDILTFPVVNSMGLEALARFKCTLAVSVVCIEDLRILTAKSHSKQLQDFLHRVIEGAHVILKELGSFKKEANVLLTKTKGRYKQWGKMLISKGDFAFGKRHSIVPVYSKRVMPENVTMYENEIIGDPKFRTDGNAQFYKTGGELAVMVELKHEIIARNQEELHENDVFCLVENLVENMQQLVIYATNRLKKATEELNNSVFDDQYSVLKERVNKFEYETNYDPLAGLDLKNCFAELAARKEELLNTCEHISTYAGAMESFIKIFIRYCKQVKLVGHKKNTSVLTDCSCFCGRITSEKFFETMDDLQNADFMISLPVTDKFLKEFCCCAEVDNSISSLTLKKN